MKVKYLSYKQATDLCHSYQYLRGLPFDKNDPGESNIQSVLVAPYSRILQWKFVLFLLHGWPAADALSINVNDRYDVLLLPEKLQEAAGGGLRFKHLRDYLREHNIQPEFIDGKMAGI